MAFRHFFNPASPFRGASRYFQPIIKSLFRGIARPRDPAHPQVIAAHAATDKHLQRAIALMPTTYDSFTFYWPNEPSQKQALPMTSPKQDNREIIEPAVESRKFWGEYMCLGGDLMQVLGESARLRDSKPVIEEPELPREDAEEPAELASKNLIEQAMNSKGRKLVMLKDDDFREKDLPLFMS